MSAARPAWVPRINSMSSRVLSSREFTLPSHEVFASQRDVRFREMEYAVPRESVAGVLTKLKAMTDHGDLRIPFPVEVRFAAADDLWMSTATGRESAYVAVHQYHRIGSNGATSTASRRSPGRWGAVRTGAAWSCAGRSPARLPQVRRLRRGA